MTPEEQPPKIYEIFYDLNRQYLHPHTFLLWCIDQNTLEYQEQANIIGTQYFNEICNYLLGFNNNYISTVTLSMLQSAKARKLEIGVVTDPREFAFTAEHGVKFNDQAPQTFEEALHNPQFATIKRSDHIDTYLLFTPIFFEPFNRSDEREAMENIALCFRAFVDAYLFYNAHNNELTERGLDEYTKHAMGAIVHEFNHYFPDLTLDSYFEKIRLKYLEGTHFPLRSDQIFKRAEKDFVHLSVNDIIQREDGPEILGRYLWEASQFLRVICDEPYTNNAAKLFDYCLKSGQIILEHDSPFIKVNDKFVQNNNDFAPQFTIEKDGERIEGVFRIPWGWIDEVRGNAASSLCILIESFSKMRDALIGRVDDKGNIRAEMMQASFLIWLVRIYGIKLSQALQELVKKYPQGFQTPIEGVALEEIVYIVDLNHG